MNDNYNIYGKYGCWWEGGTGVSPDGHQCGECYPDYEDRCPHLEQQREIAEMANDYYEAMLKARGALGSMNEGAPRWYAKEFYAKGYRKQEWISVDERLPEQGVPVLVYKNRYSEAYGNMETAYFENGRWRGSCGEFITHWMPLPEPPRKEDEGK